MSDWDQYIDIDIESRNNYNKFRNYNYSKHHIIYNQPTILEHDEYNELLDHEYDNMVRNYSSEVLPINKVKNAAFNRPILNIVYFVYYCLRSVWK